MQAGETELLSTFKTCSERKGDLKGLQDLLFEVEMKLIRRKKSGKQNCIPSGKVANAFCWSNKAVRVVKLNVGD